LDKLSQLDEIILMGNLNVNDNNKMKKGIKNGFNEESINENGEKLSVCLYTQNELQMNNIFYSYKFRHKYIFENIRGSKSTIDLL